MAYNADTQAGVITVYTQPRSNGTFGAQGFFLFGGTSAGSPQWAAIAAIADQAAGHRLGYLNAAFYQIGQTPPTYGPSFHDVTDGNNSVLELDSSNNDVEVDGYAAGPGWDATTGLGSPKVDGIVGRLIALTSPGDAVGRDCHVHAARERRGARHHAASLESFTHSEKNPAQAGFFFGPRQLVGRRYRPRDQRDFFVTAFRR